MHVLPRAERATESWWLLGQEGLAGACPQLFWCFSSPCQALAAPLPASSLPLLGTPLSSLACGTDLKTCLQGPPSPHSRLHQACMLPFLTSP
jgi:hypothetical protein